MSENGTPLGRPNRTRCKTCGAPLLLTKQCPYCSEALDLLGEFADWVESGGAK
jgi:hypothetical protein